LGQGGKPAAKATPAPAGAKPRRPLAKTPATVANQPFCLGKSFSATAETFPTIQLKLSTVRLLVSAIAGKLSAVQLKVSAIAENQLCP